MVVDTIGICIVLNMTILPSILNELIDLEWKTCNNSGNKTKFFLIWHEKWQQMEKTGLGQLILDVRKIFWRGELLPNVILVYLWIFSEKSVHFFCYAVERSTWYYMNNANNTDFQSVDCNIFGCIFKVSNRFTVCLSIPRSAALGWGDSQDNNLVDRINTK